MGVPFVTWRNCPNSAPLALWADDGARSLPSAPQRAMTDSSPAWRAYDPTEAVVFHKTRERWGELSNMAAGFPLVVAGEEWPTSEALYQACRFPHLPDVQQLLLEQSSPMAAKMRSKPYRPQSRSDWDKVRTKVMRWVLRVKLAQNFADFSRVLAETGDREIVEQSHRDRYWGAVPDEVGVLRGENVLGRLLMELRTALQESERADLLVVEAPGIPDFLVLRQPIGRVIAGDRPDYSRKLF